MSVTVTAPENLIISIENGGESFDFVMRPPETISVALSNSQGPAGPAGEQVYVQSTQPEFKAGVPAFWVQTGMNAGQDFTFWFFDGTINSP